MSIQIKELSFSYGDNKVLNNLTIDIKDGDLTAVMGLSGCGKTTRLRILLGLNKPASGSITLEGLDYNNTGIEKIRELISYIPQHGALYPHLTIKDNILLPIKIKRAVTNIDQDKMKDLAATCKIETELFNRYPSELSGGQRQRVSVLRALMMNTPYIFLDEPLSALDSITKISIQKEFKSIFESNSKTIIMVTHSLTEAKYLCNKMVIMNKGVIEQYDTTENVISSAKTPFVKEFISSQQ
jgi:ABC-type proline/glycine betaine transport system ATPase subunit